MDNKKNILIILTGGTFSMYEKKTGAVSITHFNKNNILREIKEAAKIANLEFKNILNIDSSDMTPKNWELIANTIKNNYTNYDGFVIIHGTDTMAYTATALSFIMKNTEKPIILTGSQKPLRALFTDAKNNFLGALIFATKDIPEIAIYFNYKLLRGNRSTKISSTNYDAFNTFNYPPLGTLGIKLRINKKAILLPKKPQWQMGFNTNIVNIKVFPGLNPKIFDNLTKNQLIKAIILETYGAGHLPQNTKAWLHFVEKSITNNKIVIITSQAPHGYVDLSIYEHGRVMLKLGAISSKDMTKEATIVKTMFALNKFKNPQKIKDFINNNYCGELSL